MSWYLVKHRDKFTLPLTLKQTASATFHTLLINFTDHLTLQLKRVVKRGNLRMYMNQCIRSIH
jgi:hypothetical protein